MNDHNSYLKKMEKTMSEKIFFLDKIDFSEVELIVDFGCANGVLIKYIDDYTKGSKNLIGFDNYQYFIELCEDKFSDNKNIIFESDYNKLLSLLKDKKYCIIFSSCLHELNEKDILNSLKLMKNSYIVIIRDMYFDEKYNSPLKSVPDLTQIAKTRLNDFENRYGKIDNLKNLYHLFLKYTYIKNWESEIQENYFSVDYERIIRELSDFEIILDQPYTLPFKKEEIKKNFDYDLKYPTHRKLILKRRKEWTKKKF